MYETELPPAHPDHDDRNARIRTLRHAGIRAAAAPGQKRALHAAKLSSTWRCRACGTERHFAEAVPEAAASPCAACGGAALHAAAER
ncbi:MAG: hypothetical protein ABW277_22405 [Longimicrobiaceae bacterium]